MFSRQSMQCFTDSRKDVMYDYLQRADVNWRSLQVKIARSAIEKTINNFHMQALQLDIFTLRLEAAADEGD